MCKKQRICLSQSQSEIVEKKSRFIANISPISSEKEAEDFIDMIKKKYYDARHNCYAYVIRNDGKKKCSDDGEPSRTAGKPILDVIEGRGLCDICIVVTRYFGGTLLGTGGLVRAYGEAAAKAADSCTSAKLLSGRYITITSSYDLYGKISRIITDNDLHLIESKFEDIVTVKVIIPADISDRILDKIRENTAANAHIISNEDITYIVKDGKAIIIA